MALLSYSQALDIAQSLAHPKTNAERRALKMLNAKCAETGRKPTFVIIRYGNPLGWDKIPVHRKPFRKRCARAHNIRRNYNRPCHLEHLKTGKIIKAKSITSFCKRAKLDKFARYHISPVLDGDRIHHKKWFLPEMLHRIVEMRDVYGNEYRATVKELVLKHNIPAATISRLLSGETKSINQHRLTLSSTPIEAKLAPRPFRVTKVKLTNGKKTYTGTSIRNAALKAGVGNLSGLYSAAYGFRDEVQGFRVKEIEVSSKKVLQ